MGRFYKRGMAKTRYFFLSFFLLIGSVFADTSSPRQFEPLIEEESWQKEEDLSVAPFKLPSQEPMQMAAIPVPFFVAVGLLSLGCAVGAHQSATENANALLEEEAQIEAGEEEIEQEKHPEKWFHFAHGAQFFSSTAAGILGFNMVVQSGVALESALATFGFLGLGAALTVTGTASGCYMLQNRTYERRDSP